MKTRDFDYALPPELIAQAPPPRRGDSRMLVLRRDQPAPEHSAVIRLPDILAPNDLLVLNDTRVIPARLFGKREDTGGQVEILLLEEQPDGAWFALYKASGHARPGQRLDLARGRLRAEIEQRLPEGRVALRLYADGPAREALEAVGAMPLPPYIRRPRAGGAPTAEAALDRERYQTVYARAPGAVAAPTAGLHFTPELLDAIRARGTRIASLTLHVGPGTFKPVKAEDVEDHAMDAERYEVGEPVAEAVRETRARGGRVVAVGSTTVRTLETVATGDRLVAAGTGRSALFIRPPYAFRVVDAMLTNFHLPMSTLLMMVCAFAGTDRVLAAYREAIRLRYRFYSYGDCMLLV
jgi:S-adenosylmethionine:tRNA ribosyltransferase-isomerase